MLYLWHVTVKYPFYMAQIFRRQHPMSSDINSKNSSHQLFICRPIFFKKKLWTHFPIWTSWDTWKAGENKHTETEKNIGCQTGRDLLQREFLEAFWTCSVSWLQLPSSHICKNSQNSMSKRMPVTLCKVEMIKTLNNSWK